MKTLRRIKKIRKIATGLMLASLVLGVVSPAIASGLVEITQIAGGNGGGTNPASTIYFGNFWQSYNGNGSENGLQDYNYEGIKWRVLANQTASDSYGNIGVLLLSDQGLYGTTFSNYKDWDSSNEWIDSGIRNTMTSFAEDAFSDKEYAAITETTHTAGGEYPDKDIESTDKIFVLSADEAIVAAYGFTDNASATPVRQMTATDAAKDLEMYSNGRKVWVAKDGNSLWWLRSPGNADAHAYVISSDGSILDGVYVGEYGGYAVRPALNLNRDSILLLSAAVGGKGNAACSGAFGLDNNYTGADGWKLTLKDESLNTPTIASAERVRGEWNVNELAETAKHGDKELNIAGTDQVGGAEKLIVTYSNATTGTNKYVSALLYDQDGNTMLNYAKVASTETSDSGEKVKVDLGNLAVGKYKVKFFGEEANGDCQTDYASELSSAYDITVTGEAGEVITTLKGDYANSGLTANLTNGAKLGFESGKYDTIINIATGSGEIIGGAAIAALNANEDAIITGFVNAETAMIASGKQITASGVFVSDKYAAFGKNAVVKGTAANSVAIGNGSVADTVASVSVGCAGSERKITNVAAGTADTDAVNVGQMSAALDEKADISALNATTTVTVNGGANINSGAGIEFIEGGNITLKSEGNKITISATGGGGDGAISAGGVLKGADAAKAHVSGTAVASGYNSEAAAKGSIASGFTSGVSENSTSGIALGEGATVGYNKSERGRIEEKAAAGSIAIGSQAKVTGINSIAVGVGHVVTGNNSGTFGDPTYIDGDNSYAIGNSNNISATATGSFIIGNESIVTTEDTFVIGSRVTKTAKNSVILGSGSEATEENTVSVGSAAQQRRIVNAADGINPTDAANMRQLNAVRNELGAISQETREVGAISAALAGLHYVEPSGEEGDKFVGAVAYGNYRGESAGAIGVAYKPNPNFMLSASTSVGNSQNAYNAGISLKFGKGETAKTRAELQKQVKFVNEENAALKNRVGKLESDKAEQGELIKQLLDRIEKLEKKQ